VAVSDNNGNLIVQFGEYGNADCMGPAGPYPMSAVPLAWPSGVAASEDFIYVTDMVNNRVVQARINYLLDNMPGLTAHGLVSPAEPASRKTALSGFSLTSFPNPFTPKSRILFNLTHSSFATLDVYNVNGQRIKSLCGAMLSRGAHSFEWDGRDSKGQTMAAGVYLYRVSAQGKVLMKKTILAR
jgi:hypothetical protein